MSGDDHRHRNEYLHEHHVTIDTPTIDGDGAGHAESGSDIPVLLRRATPDGSTGYRLTGRNQFGSKGPV